MQQVQRGIRGVYKELKGVDCRLDFVPVLSYRDILSRYIRSESIQASNNELTVVTNTLESLPKAPSVYSDAIVRILLKMNTRSSHDYLTSYN